MEYRGVLFDLHFYSQHADKVKLLEYVRVNINDEDKIIKILEEVNTAYGTRFYWKPKLLKIRQI